MSAPTTGRRPAAGLRRSRGWRRSLPRLRHPAQFVVAGFAAAVLVGTGLLLLPVSRAGTAGASLVDALFVATSAVCVTGLSTVDTPVYWSGFGQAVILAPIQVGGFGIMSLATLLGLLASDRLGLRNRLNAAAEVRSLGLSDARGVLLAVARTSALFELAGAAVLTARFATSYEEPLSRAVWLGVFHAVSAFNNAGFALFSDNMIGFATDPIVGFVLCALVVAGGLGFPVLFELWRAWRTPRRWTLHTKLVASMTVLLLVCGIAMSLALEWANPRTLGPLSVGGKVVAGVFQGVQPRTAGFDSVSTGDLQPETLLGTDVLMFIGGGSAGTAGGIKVTTFAVLLFIILSESAVTGVRPPSVADCRARRSGKRSRWRCSRLPSSSVHGTAPADHAVRPGRGPVRGHLRLRHCRAVHRHHRAGRDRRAGPARRADVPRPAGADHPRVRAGTTKPTSAVRAAGGTPDHRLTPSSQSQRTSTEARCLTCSTGARTRPPAAWPRSTVSSSSAWAASVGPWRPSW